MRVLFSALILSACTHSMLGKHDPLTNGNGCDMFFVVVVFGLVFFFWGGGGGGGLG